VIRLRGGLARRLFVAQTLIALVGAATLWLVALGIGPGIFHMHLREAVGAVDAATNRHVEEAYSSASAISIALALLSSLGAALAVSWYVTRRIAAPVGGLAAATRELAAGRYATGISDPGLGSEFATLTGSFNAMASQLANVEQTRRRLLADLAHEMRTPVSTLDAYLEGLEDGVVSVDAKTLRMLRSQTGRLARLADDITAVSRAEERQLELSSHDVEPAELVGTAVRAAAGRFAELGIALVVEVAPRLPTVRADPDRIGQVLANLLDNALRHSSTGGRVSVAAHAVQSGAAVEFSVADTGDGIPVESLPHVFERFYRVDRARDRAHGGSGIGLSIVKALVEAHGGRVRAQSDGLGCGATFAFAIPARRPPR
jgi:signal transduction histidine kinase